MGEYQMQRGDTFTIDVQALRAPQDKIDAMQTVSNIAARDAIPARKRTEGMLVRTYDTQIVWSLEPDLLTWVSVLVDVTAWHFWFTVKHFVSDQDLRAVHEANDTDGSGYVVVTNAVTGKVTAEMPPDKTYLLSDGPSTLIYDVQGIDPGGRIATVSKGTITVNGDVTRAITRP